MRGEKTNVRRLHKASASHLDSEVMVRHDRPQYDSDRLRAQTPPRVAPRLKGVVKNKGIKPVRKPAKKSRG